MVSAQRRTAAAEACTAGPTEEWLIPSTSAGEHSLITTVTEHTSTFALTCTCAGKDAHAEAAARTDEAVSAQLSMALGLQ